MGVFQKGKPLVLMVLKGSGKEAHFHLHGLRAQPHERFPQTAAVFSRGILPNHVYLYFLR